MFMISNGFWIFFWYKYVSFISLVPSKDVCKWISNKKNCLAKSLCCPYGIWECWNQYQTSKKKYYTVLLYRYATRVSFAIVQAVQFHRSINLLCLLSWHHNIDTHDQYIWLHYTVELDIMNQLILKTWLLWTKTSSPILTNADVCEKIRLYWTWI